MSEQSQHVRTVAIISPGDMGHAIGRFIQERTQPKIRVITNLTGRSHRTRHLSESAGIVLSIVTTWEAASVAKRFTDIAQKKPNFLFVDLNDLAPETTVSIASLFPQGQFIDGSIISGPSQDDGYSPSIYLSESMPVNVRIIGKKIGDASAIKMCYAPMFKSVTAIGIQACAAAKEFGLEDIFLDELKGSLPGIYNMLQALIPGIASRGSRWIGEMDQIHATYESLHLPTSILDGTVDVYRSIVDNTPSEKEENKETTFDGALQTISEALEK